MDSQEQGAKPQPLLDSERILGPRVGWLTGPGSRGRVQVDYTGNRQGPREARLALSLDESALHRAVQQRQGAVLYFENGDPSLPLLLGLLQEPSETPLLDELLLPPAREQPRELVASRLRIPLERLLHEEGDELTLQYGRASLVLRRNGEILLRGTNIQVDADSRLRLRGRKTRIN